MKLFRMNEDGTLSISEEAYLLEPFRVLYKRDKSKSKERSLRELAYIFFMEDFSSDFFDILDEAERSKAVRKSLDFPEKWKEDKAISDARKYYREMSETFSMKYLRDVIYALDKLRKFFRNFDPSATDKYGRPIFDLSKISKLIKDSDEILSNMEKLQERVYRDIKSKNVIRGSKKKNLFEDGV